MFELMNRLNVNEPIGVAISGGVDSVALAHYLVKKKYNVTLFFFNHANDYANDEFKFVTSFADKYNLSLVVCSTTVKKPDEMSQEEFWRIERYKFFHSHSNIKIATGHTLNDAVEWYIFTCCHGEGHCMPYENKNVIRPFLVTDKDRIISYCEKNKINWLEDPSNQDVTFAARNRIRHNILPEVLKINPGIFKVIKKKLLNKWRI